MQTSKRDELINKLGITDLEESNKKDLYNKFVNAGGEVIDLNKADKKKESQSSSANGKDDVTGAKQSVYQQRINEERQKRSDESQKVQAVQVSMVDTMKVNPVNRWIERFSAKLGCAFSGIINFSGTRFKRKFVDLMLEKYQNALLESRMVLASVIHQNEMIRDEIRKKLSLDKNAPFLYEIIYRSTRCMKKKFSAA